MAKKRPTEHQLETLAETHLRGTLPSEWVIRAVNPDYGTDFWVEYFRENGSSTSRIFFIQSKATTQFSQTQKGVYHTIKTKDLIYLEEHTVPAIITLFSVHENEARWIFVHRYIDEILDLQQPSWRSQEAIRLYMSETSLRHSLGRLREIATEGPEYILKRSFEKASVEVELTGIALKDKIKRIDAVKARKEHEWIQASFLELNLLIKAGEDKELFEKAVQLSERLERNGKTDDALIALSMALEMPGWINSIDQGLKTELVEKLEHLAKKTHSKEFLSYFKLQSLADVFVESLKNLCLQLTLHRQMKDGIGKLLSASMIGELNLKVQRARIEFIETYNNLLESNNIWLIIKSAFHYLATMGSEANLLKPWISQDGLQALGKELDAIISTLEDVTDFHSLGFLKHYLIRQKAVLSLINERKIEAIALFKEAERVAHLYEDEQFAKHMKTIIEQISHPKDVEQDLYMSDIQKMVRESFGELQEHPKDQISAAIQGGIDDIDPSDAMRFCTRLKLVYLSASPLGESLGLPIGPKIFYCEYAQQRIQAHSINNGFQSFRDLNCVKCAHQSPRSSQWSVRWSDLKKIDEEFRGKWSDLGFEDV